MSNAPIGFVDSTVVKDCDLFKVMEKIISRLNNDGKETTNRKYVIMDNFKNIRTVIYSNDIMPKELQEIILIEYFDSEIEGNEFVKAIIAYVTTNEDFRAKFYTLVEKLQIMRQIIKNCVVNDLCYITLF